MIEINDNSDELIIRRAKRSLRESLVILLVCAFIGGNCLLALLKANASFSIIGGIFFLAVILYTVFTIFYMVINPGITVRLNKKSKLLAIEKKELFKNSLKFYPFREIAEPIRAEAIKNPDGADDYEFIMRLKSGEEIKFLEYAASISESFNAANFMNDVIFDSPDKVRFKSTAFNEISF